MSIRPRFPLVVLALVTASVAAASLEAGAASTSPTPTATGTTPLRRPPTATAPRGTTAPSATATAAPTTSQSTAPTSSAPLPTGKPDLRCELLGWGLENAPVADGGTAQPILESNGFHSVEYALRVKNAGGPAGAAFVVRYDYVQKIGSTTNTSSKPNIPFPALAAGQEVQTARLKMSASGPGYHEVKVTLDTGAAVDEADEANNTCKLGVYVK